MRIQLHWQDSADPRRTQFVAECEFAGPASFNAWVATLLRAPEMPVGWMPMVCTEDAPCFWEVDPRTGVMGPRAA